MKCMKQLKYSIKLRKCFMSAQMRAVTTDPKAMAIPVRLTAPVRLISGAALNLAKSTTTFLKTEAKGCSALVSNVQPVKMS